MTEYLDGKEPSLERLQAHAPQSSYRQQGLPRVFGSALKNRGVSWCSTRLSSICHPLDMPPVKGINPKTGEEVVRHASDASRFVRSHFKLQADPFVGPAHLLSRYSGTIEAGSYF